MEWLMPLSLVVSEFVVAHSEFSYEAHFGISGRTLALKEGLLYEPK